jgi:hypothetical protein
VPAAAVEAPAHAVTETATKTRMRLTSALSGQRVTEADSDELFEMANLFPRTTGLPMTV